MSGQSAIEWTNATWNPVTGCSKVSPGCAHCFAQRFAERWRGIPGHPYVQGFDLRLWPERLDLPLRWRRPRIVFVNSMSDLFHEQVPDGFIADVFRIMAAARHHTFQVLTKRPERMRALLTRWDEQHRWRVLGRATPARRGDLARQQYLEDVIAKQAARGKDGPLPNVWVGVSIENRRFVDRADLLRDTPAAVRFISAEPLLGPLVWDAGDSVGRQTSSGYVWNDYTGPQLEMTDIDWLVVGGESGPRHRPVDPRWVRGLRDATRCEACAGAGDALDDSSRSTEGPVRSGRCPHCRGTGYRTAFFFKQWGGRTPKAGGRELDGCRWDEMPVPHHAMPPRSESSE